MKQKLMVGAFIVAALISFQDVFARSGSNTTLVITPSTPFIFDQNNVVGVSEDSPTGFAHGSFKSNGVAKTDMYFLPDSLFPNRANGVSIGEIVSISYSTKKGTTHAVDPIDWAFLIYTVPFVGQGNITPWYSARFGSEPYFANDPVDPANTWVEHTTASDEPNRMRFYESTAGAPGATFGSYTDPEFAAFKTGNSLYGHSKAALKVLFFSIQTGSATAPGFMGQVDGLRIQLTDGSVGRVNMEPFIVPSDKDSCKNNGWTSLLRPNGSSFGNQGDCVSYALTGK